MKKLMVNLVCLFIPFRKARRKLRERLTAVNQNKNIENRLTRLESFVRELSNTTSDPNGLAMLDLKMRLAEVPEEYKHLFYNMPDNAKCFDCGANVGLVSDIFLFLGGNVVAFEANPYACNFLRKKYRNSKNMRLICAAVSNKNGSAEISINPDHNFDQGASISRQDIEPRGIERRFATIPTVRLSEILNEESDEIYLLKLDIEGSEFDVVADIIETGAYKNIKHIVVETHSRFFPDGDYKLEKLKQLIKDNQITNINLEWK